MNAHSDLAYREQDRLARVGVTSWSEILRGWWNYDCACGERGSIDGADRTVKCCSWCGAVHTAPDDRRDLVRFIGEVNGTQVTVDAERGSAAHVEALASSWLTEFRGRRPRCEWPAHVDLRELV